VGDVDEDEDEDYELGWVYTYTNMMNEQMAAGNTWVEN